MVSDVPVGALLSGGLDSSLIVAMMSQHSKKRIHTFSIGFDEPKFDESNYSQQVANLYNTRHTNLMVTSQDLIHNIESFSDYYDEPIGDNSILPTLLVSKLTAQHVKVALTGDGGDENFAGYERYEYVALGEKLATLPKPFVRLGNNVAHSMYKLYPSKLTERSEKFVSTLHKNFTEKYMYYNSFFTSSTKYSLYTKDFRNLIAKNNSFTFFNYLYNKNLTDLDNALKVDMLTYLPDDLLYKTDIAAMAYSLELRSPFLDHEFVELVAKIPSQLKLSGKTKKKILKEMTLHYKLLPEEIVNRPKKGFTIPQNKWFKGPLKTMVYETILSDNMFTIFDAKKLESYLDNYYSTKLNYDNNIFALLSLAQWLRKYS